MKRSVVVVLVLFLLLACVAAFSLVAGDSGDGPPSGGDAPVETGDGLPDAERPGAVRQGPGRRRANEPTAPETPARLLALSGRVVSASAGVAGATVEACAVPARDAGLSGADLAARRMFGHLLDDAGLRSLVGRALLDGDSGSAAQQAVGRGMRVGMRLLADEGAMDRMMRFARLAQARLDFDAPWPVAGTTTTGPDGSFTFEEVPEGEVELRVRAPRYVPRKQRVKAGDTDVSVVLAPGAPLEGQVVSAGRPIAGATVRTRTATLETDGGGTFRTDGASTPQDTVYVTAPGFIPDLRIVDLTPTGLAEPLVVALQPAGRVVGRVVDSSGAPVGRATVSSGSSGFNPMMLMGLANAGTAKAPPPYTQTAADGQFALEGLAAGAATIRVEHDGYLAAKVDDVEITVGETAGPLEVELVRESTVAGRVTDQAGAPVAGATVKVSLPAPGGQAGMAIQMTGGAWARGTTDADGRYLVRGLPAGDRDLEVEAAGYLTARTSVSLGAEGQANEDVTLEPGKSVAGIVTGPGGEPLAGATVTLAEASGGQANPMAAFLPSAPDATTVSAADGTFSLSGLQEGPYTITATAAGYLPVTIEGVAAGASDVALTVAAGATLRGVVIDEVSGKPVAGAWVLRSSNDATAPANPWMRALQRDPRVLTDADGAFAMSGLEPAEYTLTARRDGFGDSAALRVTCAAGETLDDLSLVLTAGEVLRGRVLTADDGAPVEGALVFVMREEGTPAAAIVPSDISGGAPTPPPDSIHATTGPSGDFVLEGLTAGTVTVEARHVDFAPAALGSTEVPGNDVTVRLSEGGAVQGYLRNAEKRPVAGRQVMLTQGAMGSGGVRTAETDANGFYRIERMRPGGYQLMFTDPKSPFGVSGMTSVTLRDGQTVHHDFGPKVGTRPVSGAVLEDGRPVAGATVVLTGSGNDMKFTQSGDDGRFRFDGLEPGEYTLVVQRELMGGGSVRQTVTVAEDGEVADVRIEVPTLAVAGTVVDAATGDPVAMAQIELLREGAGGATSIQEMVADTAGRGFSGPDGAFELRGVEAGTFRMRVSAAGFAPTTLEGVRSGGAGVRVRLSRGQELVVTVLGPDGAPVPRANVSAVDAAGVETAMFDMSMSGITGNDGKATLRLGAGRYTLQVDAPEHPPANLEVESQAGTATVRLVAGGALDVTVTAADGKPVPGAEIEVRDAAGRPIRRLISMANFAGATGRTDAAGNVQRTGLAPGDVTVVVKLASGVEVTQPAKVVAGETTALAIRLR